MSGGLPQILCDLPALAVGGSWNRDGDIIVGNLAGGLLRVRETGGVASPVTALDPARKEEFHLLPTFLPDGRHFVYLRIAPGAPDNSGTYVGTLDAKPEDQSPQRLLPYEVGLTYAAAGDSGPGQLLFLREGTLMAQPFDARRLALAGDPVPLAERVGSFRDGGFFAASNNGVLVYRTADTDFQLAWFDRQGTMSGRVSEPGGFRDAALSPDGARAVASRTNPQDTAKADLWLFDLSRGSGATRLTLGTGIAEFPIWSPDGKRIVFTFGNSVLRQKLASGEGDEQELVRSNSAGVVQATDWSPDGRFLLYTDGGLDDDEMGSLGASRPRSEACAVRADSHSLKTRAGSHRLGDGLPTSRTSPARMKSTSADLRRTSAAAQPAREAACWCRAAAAPPHAGVGMAASSFISRPTGK